MRTKLKIAASATLLISAPLVAENVNGFENFVLSRNDGHASAPAAIADFSSRTRTEDSWALARFSSRKPTGAVIVIR